MTTKTKAIPTPTLGELMRDSIDGYTSDNAARKKIFHSLARRRLRKLANALGFTSADYDLRTNAGGAAVSGEVTLHTDCVYIQVSQPAFGVCVEILVRACDGRDDYTGGKNHYFAARNLDPDYMPHFVDQLRAMGRFGLIID